MQKLLIYWVCGASLLASGCSTIKDMGDSVPQALDRLPLIHRPDIQQGNVVDQEMINKLEPGMSKSQVRFLMGTPMLVDVFHQDRWDYLYRMKQGNDKPVQEVVSLHFADDRLTRVEGDFRPMPDNPNEMKQKEQEAVVTVPDYEGDRKGIITRVLESVGIETEE